MMKANTNSDREKAKIDEYHSEKWIVFQDK
jgi:hypothetical protein